MDAVTTAAQALLLRWLNLKGEAQSRITEIDGPLYCGLGALFVELEKTDPNWYMRRAGLAGYDRLPGSEDSVADTTRRLARALSAPDLEARWHMGMAAAEHQLQEIKSYAEGGE